MIMQTNRNKKNSRSKHHSKNGRYNNTAPLEPIYENEHDGSGSGSNDETYDPLREHMLKTILNHISSNDVEGSDSSSDGLEEESSSQFQIITDNASSHPEFLATKRKPSKSGDKQSSTSTSTSILSEGRWGSGESPSSAKKIANLDSSINTASTAFSLTDDDNDRSAGSFDENKNMTSREILQQAADLVDGNYGYNHSGNINFHSRTGGRRQARRSSLPSMPTRSTSETCNLSPQAAPSSKRSPRSSPSSFYDSLRLESRAVVLDKFGIPIRRTTSSNGSSSSSSSSSGNSSNRRRRRERRSSMPSRADQGSCEVPIASKTSVQVFDKFGIPIGQTSTTTTSSTTGRRRRERRLSMPKSMPTTRSSEDDGSDQLSVLLDKFGIPIRPARSSSSSSSTNSTGRRRQGRRSSMPTRSVTFDLPKPSKPSSIDDCDSSLSQPESGSVPVDKFGIPIWPKAMSNNNSNNNDTSNGRRRRQQRRSSMPSTTTTTSDYSSGPVVSYDKFGVPVSSCSKPNHRMTSRRRRRPSMPTHVVNNHSPTTVSCTASAMRFIPEELQIPGHKNNTATNKNKNQLSSVLANGAPIRPERVPSEDSFGSKDKLKPVVNLEQQHNASFHDAHDTHLEVTLVRPTDSKNNNSSSSNSSISVNSLQQKDGEWWW